MADVQIQSNGGRSGWGVAIIVTVVLVLVVVAWLVFGGGLHVKKDVNVNVKPAPTST